MTLPPYYLSRPEADWSPPVLAAFDGLFRRTVETGAGRSVDYTLHMPKWQFLCYLTDYHEVVVHGSGAMDIAEFEPRQSNDALEFGDQRAVYAASDGLWAMYFAIVNRDLHVRSLVNACLQIGGQEPDAGRRYYFSINGDALPHDPWRSGCVYILPRQGFEQQPATRRDNYEIESLQWRIFTPVKPLAKISVEPGDFPFLAQIRGHDPAVVRERALADPHGFPWLDWQD